MPRRHRFNTQPPEGGWTDIGRRLFFVHRFNTQPPEGGWLQNFPQIGSSQRFNTQPPEGGWGGAGFFYA